VAGVMIGEDDGLVVNGKTGPKVVKNPIRWLINQDFISEVRPAVNERQHFTGSRRSNPPLPL
jgi:hypothetical protein